MLRLFAHGAGAAGGKGLLGEAFAPGISLVYPKETPGGDHQRVTGFFVGGIAAPTGAAVSAVYPAQPKDRAYFRAELPG